MLSVWWCFYILSWAFTSIYHGPMFTLAGADFYPILIVITAATFGTLSYGLLRD